MATILHDYPSRSTYVDFASGCEYYTDNPPDFTSNEAITQLPLEFFGPRSVAEFFKEFRVSMTSDSFLTPLIPQDINPDFVITDATAKTLFQILSQDFILIFTLDCVNVTHFPLPFLDEAKVLASRNIQQFAEKLQEFQTKFLLFDWWTPMIGWNFPAE